MFPSKMKLFLLESVEFSATIPGILTQNFSPLSPIFWAVQYFRFKFEMKHLTLSEQFRLLMEFTKSVLFFSRELSDYNLEILINAC